MRGSLAGVSATWVAKWVRACCIRLCRQHVGIVHLCALMCGCGIGVWGVACEQVAMRFESCGWWVSTSEGNKQVWKQEVSRVPGVRDCRIHGRVRIPPLFFSQRLWLKSNQSPPGGIKTVEANIKPSPPGATIRSNFFCFDVGGTSPPPPSHVEVYPHSPFHKGSAALSVSLRVKLRNIPIRQSSPSMSAAISPSGA